MSINAEKCISHIRAGDTIIVPQGTGEPQTLTEAVVAMRSQIPGSTVFLGASFTETFKPEHADSLKFRAIGGIGTVSKLVAAGVCGIVPTHISGIPRLFESGAVHPDVVLLHLSGDSVDGRHSLGIVDDYLAEAMKHARVVIAEVNRRMPYMPGGTTVALDQLDGYIVTDRPLIEVQPASINDVSQRIGEFAADLIPDGACVQVGIGAAPEAVVRALCGHRNLGIHSGLMTDALYALHRSTAVDNSAKAVRPGFSVSGACFGTHDLYAGLSKESDFVMAGVDTTHDPGTLASLSGFSAINSALEIDITGQVNAETTDRAYVGATGGQVDFLRGAGYSKDGCVIIVLPATAKGGTISRIVPALAQNSVTTPRSDVQYVVTEYGVARLFGASLGERAYQLANVAAPQFRHELLEQAGSQRIGGA